MQAWFKEHFTIVIATFIALIALAFVYGCESKVVSMFENDRLINRQELQYEFDRFMGSVELRMLDLDKQDRFRTLVLENALILVQGQPFNPLGILTGFSAIYGMTQAGRNVVSGVKKVTSKRRNNNG